MKVKITKANMGCYWYSNKIGQIFDVEEFSYNKFVVVGSSKCIDKDDCEIIEENKQSGYINWKRNI